MIPADMQPSDVVERSVELAGAGRYEENDKFLRAGLARFPSAPEVHLHAGAAALARGESAEAKRLAFRAVELAPEDPGVLTQAASLAFNLEELGDAERWIRHAADIAPDDFALAEHLAHLVGKCVSGWLRERDNRLTSWTSHESPCDARTDHGRSTGRKNRPRDPREGRNRTAPERTG